MLKNKKHDTYKILYILTNNITNIQINLQTYKIKRILTNIFTYYTKYFTH